MKDKNCLAESFLLSIRHTPLWFIYSEAADATEILRNYSTKVERFSIDIFEICLYKSEIKEILIFNIRQSQ